MKSILPLFALALCAATPARAEDPTKFEVGALTFSRPAEWTWVAVSSPMRKAQLNVAGAEGGKPAEITFFHFGPGAAGGVDANVKRWLAQFQSAPDAEKVEATKIGGKEVTFVKTEGTFASGMPGQPATPMKDYALRGAIIDDPAGAVFVKMTGPAAVVKGAEEKFTAFVTAAAEGK
jgi:hypothetical protein